MAKDENGENIPTFEQASAKLRNIVDDASRTQRTVGKTYDVALEGGGMVETPDLQGVAHAAFSDHAAVNPEELFTVKGFDGTVGRVKGADLKRVLDSGEYVLESKEETINREDNEKYGDKWGQAAVLGVSRGLTFGASDVALKGSGAYTGDELRGIENANKAVSITGEVGGAILPAFFSGGTSAVASGARLAGSGLRASEALGAKAALVAEGMLSRQAGKAATILTEAAKASAAGLTTIGEKTAEASIGLLAKSLEKSGYAAKQASNIASKMLYGGLEHMAPEAANLAVQGALQGAGRLVTEDTFGTAEFNAENLVAYAGLGALVGGGFGAAIGAGKAIIPKASELLNPLTSKIKQVAGDAFESVVSKEKAALNLVGMSPAELVKARAKRTNFDSLATEEIEAALVKHKPTSHSELGEALVSERGAIGKKLEGIYKQTDEAMGRAMSEDATQVGAITKDRVADFTSNVMKSVDEHLGNLGIAVTGAEKARLFRIGDEFTSEAFRDLSKAGFSATKLQEYAESLQKSIYGIKGSVSTIAEGSDKLVRKAILNAVRKEQAALVKEFDTFANRGLSGGLSDQLKNANQRYSVLKDLTFNTEKNLAKETLKGGELKTVIDLKDIAAAGVGGLPAAAAYKAFRMASNSFSFQKRVAMGALEESGRKAGRAIQSGLKSFATSTKELSRAVEPSIIRHLVSSPLAIRNENGKQLKPRTEAEAYNNIIENANRSVTDPESVLKHSNRQTASLYEHAPNTAAAIDAKYLQMLQFIADKSKKGNKNVGLFDSKKGKPSGFDTAKMARYIDAISNPQGIIHKAAKGKLSREHVDVMKNLFPQMHNQMKMATLDFIAKNKDKGLKLSYQQQLQLGQLIGVQAHESTSPENVQALQSAFSEQTGASGDSDFTAARADNLNKSETVGGGAYDSVDSGE